MNAIQIEGLTKRYGQRTGVRDLNLTVPAGTVFGFLGPNGAGKTTTIRVLLAMLRATDGRASVFGLDCWRNSHKIKEEVGYVPGDLRLYSWMTARSALDIVGRVRRRDIVGAGLELAGEFELDIDVRVRNMSRGMRQKLGLVLALAHRPNLLVLDEPSSALDPLMQQKLHDHLRARASRGATVFFSSHTLSEVEHLCDRVAILRNGRLVADEPLTVLKKRARREATISWKTDQPNHAPPLPDFLEVVERNGATVRCVVNGPVMDLVRWAATQELDDFTIAPPDLDAVFRQYYEDSAPPEITK